MKLKWILVLLVVAIFFAPIPFYVSGDKAVCLIIGLCPRHGWNLGPSLWQRISGSFFSRQSIKQPSIPQTFPSPTCRPRPACLDAEPRCLIAETADMCPPAEIKSCGGIANIKCPSGYTCQLDGSYPDAGGKCVKE